MSLSSASTESTSITHHDHAGGDWTEASIAAVVRSVLDTELRDRVNGVVDARLTSESERRRWRHDRGVF